MQPNSFFENYELDNVICLCCSSSESSQGQRQMWEEISLRYQQILHREYRMLNLPSYPVEGGNFYLYYVPVIVNPGYVSQNSGVNSEYNKETTSAQETRENNDDVIYIEDSDDDCVCPVKEEPSKMVQAVESFYDKNIQVDSKDETFPREAVQSSHDKNIKVEIKKEIFPRETVLRKVKKNQRDNPASFPMWEETTRKVNERFDYKNSFIEHKQSNDRRDGSTSSDDDDIIRDQVQDRYCDDKNIEVTEDFIRIFKGYTIEYHPLRRDNTVKQRFVLPRSHQCSERDEKIQDLKKRVAEHKVELEKLKQSVEGNEGANGLSKQLTDKYLNGKVSIENNQCSFTGQRARKILKDCPSAQIHYFPSGERKTFLPRRRKQTSPRRIDTLSNVKTGREASDVKIAQTETIVNGQVNNSLVKRKRKLTPSPEIVKEKLSENTKRVQCSKKSKAQRKHKKAQNMSQSPSPKLKKGQQSWHSKTQVELSYAANLGKASLPEDISQEEFLSVFGLLRKDEKQGETLNV